MQTAVEHTLTTAGSKPRRAPVIPLRADAEDDPCRLPDSVARRLKSGAWIMLRRGSGRVLRARLSRAGDAQSPWIFVSSSGEEAARYATVELLAALDFGVVELIEDDTYGNALATVIRGIREGAVRTAH